MSGKPKPDSKPEGIGRPTKFTPERCAAIVNDIAHRIPYEMAAEANGICEDTLYEWLKIAKAHRKEGVDSDYTRFSESIKRAETSRVVEHMDNIASHVNQWQSDAWLLERRWYKHFGSNAQVNELNKRLALLEGDTSHGEGNQERS